VPATLPAGNEPPYPLDGSVGLRACPDTVAKRNISVPYRELKSGFATFTPSVVTIVTELSGVQKDSRSGAGL
jgi:hypothetical protein